MQYHAGSLSKQVSYVSVVPVVVRQRHDGVLAIPQAGNHVCVLAEHHSTPLKDLATDPCVSLWNLPKTYCTLRADSKVVFLLDRA